MSELILELKSITKEYPGVRALDNVSFDLKKGEVHALLGENGAGKSTLIKIITGAVQATKGNMFYNGEKINNISPALTLSKGIACIYQEFNLFPNLSAADNLFYGCEIKKGPFIDYRRMEKKASEIFNKLGVHINPNTLVRDLKVGQRQIVEIARALLKDVNIIIMDEPTASLTEGEIEILFKIVDELKRNGVAVIYISHRLEEVFKISDRVTIFRDGKHVISNEINKFNKKSIVEYMVGRELVGEYPRCNNKISDEVLKLDNITTNFVKNISFSLRKGEIIGLAGLVGSGRTEVARAIFGVDKILEGKIYLNGDNVQLNSPMKAIEKGIGFITEDRKNLGLILGMSVKDNITFSSLKKLRKNGFIDLKLEEQRCDKIIDYLRIKTSSLFTKVENLSGGNQQKIVIGKWLLTNSDILIFDEPTRGIDVGAKQEIYKIMQSLTEEGKSIIMISSEMPELIGMSDRIFVMSNGRIVSEYSKEEISQEKIFLDSAKER